MKTIRLLCKLLQNALLVLLSLMLLSNLWIIGAKTVLHQPNPTVFGWTWAVVLTGSMEPVISGNDMIVTKDQADYQVDDIIMYQSGDMLVTHRIVEETGEGFITKGDANNAADQRPVALDQIIGKVMWVIPGVGVAMGYLKTPLGMLCMVLLGFLLLEIPYLFEKRRS